MNPRLQSRMPRYFSSKDGNVAAKSKKLFIQVFEEEESGQEINGFLQYGKNSPSNARQTLNYPPPKIHTTTNKSLFYGTDSPKSKSANNTPKNYKAKEFLFDNKTSPRNQVVIGNRQTTQKNLSPRVQASKLISTQSSNTIAPFQPYVFKVNTNMQSKGRPKPKTPTVSRKYEEPDRRAQQTRSIVTSSSVKSLTPKQPIQTNQTLQPQQSQLKQIITQVQSNVGQAKQNLTPEEAQARSEMLYKEHLFQTFQALRFVKNLPPPNLDQLRVKRKYLPKRPGYENFKTLVLDLDETLVHCSDDLSNNPDVILPIKFPTGETIQAGMNIRPHALECLKAANENYEVVIFTASHQCYADVVLDYLDPQNQYIHHRLYRDSCIQVEGVFVKDLRVLVGRRLKDIVIVDNAAYSFGYQIDNGVPIISWHDNYYDSELYNLIDYLKGLSTVDDIREVNRKTFQLRTFYEDYINEYIRGSKS